MIILRIIKQIFDQILKQFKVKNGGALGLHLEHTTRVAFVTPLKGTAQATN